MHNQFRRSVMSLAMVAASVMTVSASAHADPTPERAAAMAKLSFMSGVWVGHGEGTNQDGTGYSVTQTERMGPMLGGDVIVIEGRGYKDDGTVGFNALGVVSWDPQSGKYELRSYAMGYSGTFELKPTADGYIWETPAGPGAVIRYTATVKDHPWREIGEYVGKGRPPVKTFEMNLERVSDTDWPVGKPVSPTGK